MPCIDHRHLVVLQSHLYAYEEVLHVSPSMSGLTRYELEVQTPPIDYATYRIPQYAQMHTQLSPTELTVSHSRAEAHIDATLRMRTLLRPCRLGDFSYVTCKTGWNY